MRALRYAAGLVFCCGLALLGLIVNLVPDPGSPYGPPNLLAGAFRLLWIAPAIYLLVWQSLFRPSLASGLIGGGVTALFLAAAFPIAASAIIASGFILGIPLVVGAIAAIAFMLDALPRYLETRGEHASGKRVHFTFGVIAFIGLSLVMFLGARSTPTSWGEMTVAVGALLLPFMPHATIMWIATQPDRRPHITPGRILVLISLAWLLPALALTRDLPTGTALGWPWHAPSIIQDRQARLDLLQRSRIAPAPSRGP